MSRLESLNLRKISRQTCTTIINPKVRSQMKMTNLQHVYKKQTGPLESILLDSSHLNCHTKITFTDSKLEPPFSEIVTHAYN